MPHHAKNKPLSDLSLQQLWELFPITLSPHKPQWALWAKEEMAILSEILSPFSPQIDHIGSTAIPNIWAKPIIDILIRIPDNTAFPHIAELMDRKGYILMSRTPTRMSFNKGYTPSGYAERVFHIHFHLTGDDDQLLFRDYLIAHPDDAHAYEQLKKSLLPALSKNRDGYTEAKTDFIRRIVRLAADNILRRPTQQQKQRSLSDQFQCSTQASADFSPTSTNQVSPPLSPTHHRQPK